MHNAGNVKHHSRTDPRNEVLQTNVIALNTAVELLLQSLKIFMGDLRGRSDEIEEKGMEK